MLHSSRWCRKQRDCNTGGCTRKHSKFLHEALAEEFKSKNPDPPQEQPKITNYNCCGETSQIIALPIAPVNVRVPGQSHCVHTLALLDPGSNKTFCSKELVGKLEAKGRDTVMSMETLTNVDKVEASELALEVSAVGSRGKGRAVINIPKVCAISNFPPFDASIPSSSAVQAWIHLQDLRLPQLTSGAVALLIGQDAPDALLPIEVREGEIGQPYAMCTMLGWTLNGPLTPTLSTASEAVCNFIHTTDKHEIALESQVENFWIHNSR